MAVYYRSGTLEASWEQEQSTGRLWFPHRPAEEGDLQWQLSQQLTINALRKFTHNPQVELIEASFSWPTIGHTDEKNVPEVESHLALVTANLVFPVPRIQSQGDIIAATDQTQKELYNRAEVQLRLCEAYVRQYCGVPEILLLNR